MRRPCAQHAASMIGPGFVGLVELVEPGIGVGLQDSGVAGQVLRGMLAAAIRRVEEHRRRRTGAAERPVVAHIGPSRPVTVLPLASTGTVVSSPWMRSAAKTWRRISSTSGISVAAQRRPNRPASRRRDRCLRAHSRSLWRLSG